MSRARRRGFDIPSDYQMPMTDVNYGNNQRWHDVNAQQFYAQNSPPPASQQVIDLNMGSGGTFRAPDSAYMPAGALVPSPRGEVVSVPRQAAPYDMEMPVDNNDWDGVDYALMGAGALGVGGLVGNMARGAGDSDEDEALSIASALSPEQLDEINFLLANNR